MAVSANEKAGLHEFAKQGFSLVWAELPQA